MNRLHSFSQAPIWELQKNYYQHLGIETWSNALVPFNATSNAFIAHHYAAVIRAYIIDLYAKYGSASLFPLNILELGVGHGRFSFMLLQALENILADLDFAEGHNLYRYIMTDVVEANIEVWRTHPRLKPFIEAGKLDFAFFDAQHPNDARLSIMQQSCAEYLQHRPLVIVANFMLDVLPYDLFYVEHETLHACEVRYDLPADIPLDQNPEQLIKASSFNYYRHKIVMPYYADDTLDDILLDYSQHLTQTVFQFPIVAIELYRFFADLTPDQLWLVSEEADTEWAQLEGRNDVGLKKAGSFTSRVNLHALFEYAKRHGAKCLSPDWSDARFDSFAITTGLEYSPQAHIWAAIRHYLFDFGPKDYFRLVVSLYKNEVELDTNGCISLLELGYADPYLIFRLRKMLIKACINLTGFKRIAFERTLIRSWENYYNLGEEFDYANLLATLLFKLGNYEQALIFFSKSLALKGKSAETFYQMGKCAQYLEDLPLTVKFYQQALALAPNHHKAQRRLGLLHGFVNSEILQELRDQFVIND